MAVVMVPTGWHSGSKWDWEATVGTPVDFSKYSELTPDQLRWLNHAFPSGRACIWTTSKHSDWPQPGDSVWFHHDNYVIAIAEVQAAFENPRLAQALWRANIEPWQKGLPEDPSGWRYTFVTSCVREAGDHKDTQVRHRPACWSQGDRPLAGNAAPG